MRMLMNVVFPLEPFNSAVRDGSIGTLVMKIVESIRPEAVYFTEYNGSRGATLVVDVKQASDIPSLAEPWFLVFDAEVDFRIAMTPEDLGRSNLEALGKTWG